MSTLVDSNIWYHNHDCDLEGILNKNIRESDITKFSSVITNNPHKKEHNPGACPNCGGVDLVSDKRRGETACSECGLVIDEDQIDQGPEWRAFTAEEDDAKSRTGPPLTERMHDRGLSTMIDWRDRDSYGKTLKPRRRSEIYRLRKWQRRIRMSDARERGLTYALSEQDRIGSQLELPRSVRETAALLYRKAIEKRLIRGRSMDSIVGATLYAACKMREIPVTVEDIAMASKAKEKDINRSYRILHRKMGLQVPVVRPGTYVEKLAREMQLGEKTKSRAMEILERAREKGISQGKSPTGMAAAALYISAVMEGERRTQKEIASVAKVTEVTVRNRYKELVKKLPLKVYV